MGGEQARSQGQRKSDVPVGSWTEKALEWIASTTTECQRWPIEISISGDLAWISG